MTIRREKKINGNPLKPLSVIEKPTSGNFHCEKRQINCQNLKRRAVFEINMASINDSTGDILLEGNTRE